MTERYHHLKRAIYKIRKDGAGTNLELAEFCKIDPSKASQRFRNGARVAATGGATLSALSWVCLKRDCDLIVPDWPALRFCYRRLLRGNPVFRASVMKAIGIASAQVTQYFIDGSREPKGDRALDLLAFLHPGKRPFLEFFAYDLEDFVYSDTDSSLKVRHDEWRQQAERKLKSIGDANPAPLPKWLRAIVGERSPH